MSKSLRFTAACLITVLFSLQALAQTVTISGTIRDSTTKDPIPAVSVAIKGTSLGTYTDDKGYFSITTSAKLPVTLVLTHSEFELREMEISSTASPLEVELAAKITIGQEVVVAAARSQQRLIDAPVTVERLSSTALRNAAVPNYYEALANLKGVDMHTASIGFRTVTTRGFVSSGNTRFNQLIDGMDNQAPGLNFSVGNIVGLTELDVDNMELLSGASSALYGSGGMNGTLLITSKNPFKYQGLSFNVKQGIMHVDGKQRPAAPYYDWTMRWAKAFNNKLAFKLTWQLMKAEDWQATDYDNVARTSVLSKVIPGTRTTDPNYDGINVYGDETSANLFLVGNAIQQGIIAGINTATGGLIPNIVTNLNAQIPNGATQAVRNAVYAAYPAALQPTLSFFDPLYWGLRNGWIQQTANVSRTGYNERDLVDYGSLNFKFTAGLHYKITPGIEASWNTYWGTGTTVYTGADRYSLRDFIMAQHKLEVRHKNWFVRGYTTQENAGGAYQATALGRLMQEAFHPSIRPDGTGWYPTYLFNYVGYKNAVTNMGTTPSEANAHATARAAADVGRPLPGSAAFIASKNKISTTAIGKGGAKFLDRSDLWAAEGQVNISDAFEFSDKLEIIAGLQWKQWVMNSQGTIFSDSAGAITISEKGGYVQLKKKMFDEFLTLTGAIRYDVQTNFDGRWTPRITAVMRVAQDNNIRLSFQTAYRFPTNQNQYIDLNTGSVTLIGALPEFITYYGLNTGTYTGESVAAARAAFNPALLQPSTFTDVLPESVASGEIGYKGIIAKKLFIDVYGYYSRYKDFFSSVAVVKASSPTNALNPLASTSYSYTQNSPDIVKASGWGVGIEYQLPRRYVLGGNLFSDKLRDVPAGFITYFNAPDLRANVSLRNDNVWKGIGFNIIAKWQNFNNYEGTFVAGQLPAFTWVDAQVSYRMPKSKSVFRIGGSNILNHYARTGYGSPYVGGLYYVSYGYNIF
ncbi:MAG TPA: TonB-dependent receptor, partial [Chitinophagaceae bacterium]|nr:TonB-dependent receptor [Chitinophagaceae bacterium]